MDPLSISASICAILQTAGVVASYLNAMKDAPKERARLAAEVYDLCSLLSRLRYRVYEARSVDPWFEVVRKLGVDNGPLNDFEIMLEWLNSRLVPVGGLKKVGKILTWKFDKSDINDMLAKMERLKTLIALALADDLLCVALESRMNCNLTDLVLYLGLSRAMLWISKVEWQRLRQGFYRFS